MVDFIDSTSGDLAPRLLRALQLGQDAGGEIRGMQAAGILVFEAGSGFQSHGSKKIDISVYDHLDPIVELNRCYEIHKLSYFPSDPKNLRAISPDYVKELKSILRSEGFLATDSDDLTWGDLGNTAIENFLGFENYDGRIRNDGLIDIEVLADIRAKRS